MENCEDVDRSFAEKIHAGIFEPVDRFLTNRETAEERLQDAICQTWWMFRRYVTEKGRVLDDAVLVHSCRQRATDLRRHFVPANGTRRYQDVYDPRAYRDGRVVLLRLDGIFEDPALDKSVVGLAKAMSTNPEDRLNEALDLQSWFVALGARDQTIMAGQMIGLTYKQMSTELGLSGSHICQEARRLGLELASRAGVAINSKKKKRMPRKEK